MLSMKENIHISSEIRQFMKDLIEDSYSDFFSEFQSLLAEIEQSVESPFAEELLNNLNLIDSNINRIYYKEKLILFPFLEKIKDEIKLQEKITSLALLVTNSRKTLEQLKNTEETFKNLLKDEFGKKGIQQILNKFTLTIEKWDNLILKKVNLFETLKTFSKK